MNLPQTQPAPTVSGVQQIPLDQKVLDGSRSRRRRLTDLPVFGQGMSVGGSAPATAPSRTIDGVVALLAYPDPGIVVGQLPEYSGDGDRDRVGGVQTEEPDAGIAPLPVNIGADVDLFEVRQARHRRRPEGTNSPHRKRYQPYIGLTLEDIDCQTVGQQPLNRVRRDGPMNKKKVAPELTHDAPYTDWLLGRANAVDQGVAVGGTGTGACGGICGGIVGAFGCGAAGITALPGASTAVGGAT